MSPAIAPVTVARKTRTRRLVVEGASGKGKLDGRRETTWIIWPQSTEQGSRYALAMTAKIVEVTADSGRSEVEAFFKDQIDDP